LRNDKLLESAVNCTFEQVLIKSPDEFRQWVIDLRKTVVRLWDEEGLPPRVGFSDDEMADQFRKMGSHDISKFLTYDVSKKPNEKTVIRNNSVLGNAVNDFFPTMMKTRITYSTVDQARSIYDFFARDDLLERFHTYASRHFKRDSFFHYSTPISVGDVIRNFVVTDNYMDFIAWYEREKHSKNFGYWLCPVKVDKGYTGYNQKLKLKQNLVLNREQTQLLVDNVDWTHVTNVDWERSEHYTIRTYEYGQKLFPIGLKAFRVSFCQYAVNFPPLTARFLYERFTEHIKNQKVIKLYDPSAGWAGRLVGALAANPVGKYHYIGTDPNTDHGKGYPTTYHKVGEFFNGRVRTDERVDGVSGNILACLEKPPKLENTFEIYQLGSEVIHENPDFAAHMGTIDMVFTSPPYFTKEVYSEDPEQSCHKFTQYDAWREGFLRPTLETAVRALRRDRYLLWNISNCFFSGVELPLEEDSRTILEELGMVYKETLKMALAQMPGGNRFEETGEFDDEKVWSFQEAKQIARVKGKMKHFIEIQKGKKTTLLKYEPIQVFYKP
jgi:hypothetical protein